MLLSVSRQSLKRSSSASYYCVYCWYKRYCSVSNIAPIRRVRKPYRGLWAVGGQMKPPSVDARSVRFSSSGGGLTKKEEPVLSELDRQLLESNTRRLQDEGFLSSREGHDDGGGGKFREEDFSMNLDIGSQVWTDTDLSRLAFLLRLQQPEFDEDGFMIFDRRKAARLMRAAADYETKQKVIDDTRKDKQQDDGFDEFTIGLRMRREPNYHLIDYNYVRLERCKIPRFDTDSEVVLKFLGALSTIEQQQQLSIGGSAPVSDNDLFQLFYLYRAIPQPRPVRIPVHQLESLLNLMRGFESSSELLASRYQILITDLLHSHMPVSSREFTKLIDLVGKPANGMRPTPQHVRRALVLAGTMQRHKIPMVVGTYNTILNIAVRAGDVDTAQKIYREMMLNKMRPDRYTFGILASLFSGNLSNTKDARQHMRRPQKILELYQQVLEEGEVASIEVVNSLIRALLKCGDYISASSIFRSLLHPATSQSADSIIYGGDSCDPQSIPHLSIDEHGGKESQTGSSNHQHSQDYLHVTGMIESRGDIGSNLVNKKPPVGGKVRLAVTPMTLYEKRKRAIFEKWLVRKRQALMAQGYNMGSGESAMPLVPDEATFRMFLTYHCTVSGDYDESLAILREMEARFIAPADWLFITLFKGFYLNGGIEYSFWSLDKLDAIFKVMLADTTNIHTKDNSRLIYWAISAFHRVAGAHRAMEISRQLLDDDNNNNNNGNANSAKKPRRRNIDDSMGYELQILLDKIEKECNNTTNDKEEEDQQEQQEKPVATAS